MIQAEEPNGGDRPHEVGLRTDTGEAFHRLIAAPDGEALVTREIEAWTTSVPAAASGEQPASSFDLFSPTDR